MEKNRNKVIILTLVIAFLIGSCVPAFAENEVQSNEKQKSGWQQEGENRYYYAGGKRLTGFRKIGNAYYYFLTSAEAEDDSVVGAMADCGVYKDHIISYTGVCYRAPKKKKSKKKSEKAMARLIARCAGKGNKQMSDREKVSRAAYIVNHYYRSCKYTMKGKIYRRPYGVFYGHKASCAGATRALGLVLKMMGYKWKHVNANKYRHQWCKLKMDGRTGWADPSLPGVGYGKYPYM